MTGSHVKLSAIVVKETLPNSFEALQGHSTNRNANILIRLLSKMGMQEPAGRLGSSKEENIRRYVTAV